MPALENKSAGRLEWLTAAFITVLIVWLHVHFWRGAGALWRDEVNTVNLAQNPSFAVLSHDTFPVLMPLGVKIWSTFSHSDPWLRLLGLIFGLLVPLSFWIVARATKRPPLLSLVLAGLNPLLLCYGDSLRAYGLGSALLVFTFAAMWAFLKNPGWPRAALLALTATLAVQVLFQNAVLFFAVCLGAFAVCAGRKDFSAAGKICCAGLVAALSLLPYWQNFAGLPQAAVELRRGFSFFITQLNFEIATAFPFASFTAVWEMLAVSLAGLALFSLVQKKTGAEKSDADLAVFAGVTLVAAGGLFLGFLWFAAAGARAWYFLPPLALAAACLDAGLPLACLPPLARTAVFGLVLGTALTAAPMAYQDLSGRFTNVDQLAARITTDAAPGDFAVVTPWFCGITFDRYYHAKVPWTTLPPIADHTLHRYDLVLEKMKDTNSLAPVLAKISATLRAGHRVWVVGLADFAQVEPLEPPLLPPPPLPGDGWSDTPYVSSWSARTAYYLQQHATRLAPVVLSGDDIPTIQENLRLFAAEGWHD